MGGRPKISIVGCYDRPAHPALYDGRVLRLLLRSPWVKRVSRGVPVARLLLIAEVAILAQRHLSKLDRGQRRRLFALLLRARGRPRSLTTAERREFLFLMAKLEPRLLLGTAVRRLSPVPVPKRLLYGRRGSAARAAPSRRS
jgi:hypothetical protein